MNHPFIIPIYRFHLKALVLTASALLQNCVLNRALPLGNGLSLRTKILVSLLVKCEAFQLEAVYTGSPSSPQFLRRRLYPKFGPASIAQLVQIELLQRWLRLVQI